MRVKGRGGSVGDLQKVGRPAGLQIHGHFQYARAVDVYKGILGWGIRPAQVMKLIVTKSYHMLETTLISQELLPEPLRSQNYISEDFSNANVVLAS